MSTENQELILLEDISQIVVSSHDLQETLDHTTSLLALRLRVEVCSIYLHEDGRLVLRSTRGLNPSAVGRVSMSPEEGLTGFTFLTGKPVNAERADQHPRYKFFPETGEEEFRSYLGVPMIHRNRPIGALVIQTSEPRTFSPDLVRMLVTAASQLSSVIAGARVLDAAARQAAGGTESSDDREAFLRGMGVSPGVARGAAYSLAEEMGVELHLEPAVGSPQEEMERFETALARSIDDVMVLAGQVTRALSKSDGAIFHAHLMLLEDRSMQEKIRERIRAGSGASQAVSKVARGYVEAFLRLEDPYLRERAVDVRDIAQRLLQHLTEDAAGPEQFSFAEPTVVIAEDLTPSRLVRLVQPNLAGVVLVQGGRNSHTSILCRSAGIPAVVGLEAPLPRVEPGQFVILDGNAGLVYLSPSEHVREEYERLEVDSARLNAELLSHLVEPPVSRDGERIALMGNAALLSDLPKVLEAGGEGVGLYRTEFPFLVRSSFPDEEEQLEIYRRILEALDGRVATLRTLDVGGDKNLPYLPIPREDNPHLGWRSIRVSLELEEPFRLQMRALLRASLLGPVRVVFPMISTVDELRRARRMLEEERSVLAERGIRVPPVPVGAMIEVPSAALAVDRLAPYADFFSIGTNDLVQYILAVDRANRRVAHMYEPLHPVVLDVISQVVGQARKAGRPVSVCGEMASRPLGAAALLAAGVRELSASPGALPAIRRLIQMAHVGRLTALLPRLTGAEGAPEVTRILQEELAAQQIPESLRKGP